MCWAERQAKGQKPCQETALARFSQEHLGETKTQQQYGWEDSQRAWSIWKCCQMSGMEVFFRAPRLGLTSLPSKSVKPPSCERERVEQRFFFEGWQCRHTKPPKGLGTWKRESWHGKEVTAHDWKKKPSWPSVASSAVTFCCHCQKTRNFIFSKD